MMKMYKIMLLKLNVKTLKNLSNCLIMIEVVVQQNFQVSIAGIVL